MPPVAIAATPVGASLTGAKSLLAYLKMKTEMGTNIISLRAPLQLTCKSIT